MLDTTCRRIASVQLIGRALVLALAIGHRTNESDLFHRLGDIRPVLSDLDAADGGIDDLGRSAVGGARLGVERLELARSAAHEQQDARQAAFAQLLGMQRQGILEADKAESGRADANAAQEGPPAQHAIAARADLNERLKAHGGYPVSWNPRDPPLAALHAMQSRKRRVTAWSGTRSS